jgi:hypothetical protein
VAATGVILSAAYALWLYRRVVFGDLIKESLKTITDMTVRERAIFAPLIVMTSSWASTQPRDRHHRAFGGGPVPTTTGRAALDAADTSRFAAKESDPMTSADSPPSCPRSCWRLCDGRADVRGLHHQGQAAPLIVWVTSGVFVALA